MANLEHAIALAVQAHLGQRDKNGDPYILHPLRVMLRMRSQAAMIVAVLHDVVEDTSVTLEDLREHGFAPEIVEAIDCLTRRSSETYEEFVQRTATNSLAKQVKLGDLEDNMDVRRLLNVEENDMRRLQRYLAAWRTLQG